MNRAFTEGVMRMNVNLRKMQPSRNSTCKRVCTDLKTFRGIIGIAKTRGYSINDQTLHDYINTSCYL